MTLAPDPGTESEGIWCIFRGRELLLTDDGTLPEGAGASLLGDLALRRISIGEQGGRRCYAAELPPGSSAPAGHVFHEFRQRLDHLSAGARKLAGRASELLEWDRTHRFCGHCGTPTLPAGSARICPNGECRREHYPRISPVVIVAVERGEGILLGRSPHFPPGLYSVLAGFVEAGESAEEAAHREIFEESGLHIRNLRYFASQPWPFPHSLMLGYQADYESGVLRPARDELEDAAFFHVDRMPSVFPMKSTIANWLMADFCRRHGRPWPPGR